MKNDAVPQSVSPDPLKDKFPLLPKGLPLLLNALNVDAPEPSVNSPVTSQVPPTDIEPAEAAVATSEPARQVFCENLKNLATYQDEPSYLSINQFIRQLREILDKLGAGSGFIFDRPVMQVYPRFGNSFLFMLLQLAGLETGIAAKALYDIVNVRLQICRQSYVTYSHAGNVYSHAITPLEDFFQIPSSM